MAKSFLVWALILAAAAGCATATPALPEQAPGGTAVVAFRTVTVKTATPLPSPSVLPTPRPTATLVPVPTPVTPTPDRRKDVTRISVEDAKAKLDADEAILIDVRATTYYERGHAAGALSIPATEIGQRASGLPTKKLIILYCA